MNGYFYLASPYSNYPGGREKAFTEVSKAAGKLLKAGVHIFCPISHSHPICENSDIRVDEYDVWLPADQPFMEGAIGCIVLKMETWEMSQGVLHEIEYFTKAGKPILWMDWNDDTN